MHEYRKQITLRHLKQVDRIDIFITNNAILRITRKVSDLGRWRMASIVNAESYRQKTKKKRGEEKELN